MNGFSTFLKTLKQTFESLKKPQVTFRNYEPGEFLFSSDPTFDFFPAAYSGTILMEKSPFYSKLTRKGEISDRIVSITKERLTFKLCLSTLTNKIAFKKIPNVKFLIMMSDPYTRLQSHFSMCKREKFASCDGLGESEIQSEISNFIKGKCSVFCRIKIMLVKQTL